MRDVRRGILRLSEGVPARYGDAADGAVVTKSNNALRVTADDGWLVRRRDGSEDADGTVTDEMCEVADAASFPSVPLLSGDVLKMDTSESVEDHLEALGYR
ncbi:hypothetical protein GCM10009037_01730 [Halarchaeum grantii]|uniref:Uncharacterized protein n=1 Tax=Halarchaeum grantii TaxID=1193105 RepID=A0A830F567_9EURY|nr:hypothetical protein [Halarchaeum grantii]GGL22016.1 hypothetical protein GCM10009037_01730 [Halarchaeum grantii]